MKGTEANGLDRIIGRFNRRLRFARASELALSGRLLEAETLLASKERFPNTWEELDLLARIRVREGKYAEALKLWRIAFTLTPHSARAQAYIHSLEVYVAAKFQRQREIFLMLWALWGATVIGVVAVVMWKAFR